MCTVCSLSESTLFADHRLPRQSEGHNRLAAVARLLQIDNQLGLEGAGFVDLDLAAGDLVGSSAVIAELADAKSPFGSDRRNRFW